jgi:hypothetical protein
MTPPKYTDCQEAPNILDAGRPKTIQKKDAAISRRLQRLEKLFLKEPITG